MSNPESDKEVCKNCGHSLKAHFKEKSGRCTGGADSNDERLWCIANCEKFWE